MLLVGGDDHGERLAGRTVAELDEVIRWLTGFDQKTLQQHLDAGTTFEDFFAGAPLNPSAALITGVVTSARCGYRKPHPEIYRAALQLTSAAPGDSVMVGDSVSADVRGAEALGMHAAFIDRDGTRQVPADVRVIRSLLDIPLAWPPEGTAR